MNRKKVISILALGVMFFLLACDHFESKAESVENQSFEQVDSQATEENNASSKDRGINQEASLDHRNLDQVQLTDQEKALIADLPKNADPSDWNLTLINRDNPIKKELNWPLDQTSDGHLLDQRIIRHYEAWKAQAEKDGYPFVLISAYRSLDHQEANYSKKLEDYMNQGYSQEEAEEIVQRFQQPRGASEHHTGLAIDMISQEFFDNGGTLQASFAEEPAYPYYLETMAEHGFILRYLEDKTDITGVYFEPWHYRYVGKENAQFITQHNLSLEEYLALLERRDQTKEMGE